MKKLIKSYIEGLIPILLVYAGGLVIGARNPEGLGELPFLVGLSPVAIGSMWIGSLSARANSNA